MDLAFHIINERCKDSDEKISLCHGLFSNSVEWPAVVVRQRMPNERHEWQMRLPALYLSISRARVYCSVVIVLDDDETLDNCKDLLDLLEKLREHVTIDFHHRKLIND